MLDLIQPAVSGHLIVRDLETKEIYVDKHNDILYGNMATALANALIGNSEYFLTYMAFGNGGVYVTDIGIEYKSTMSSVVKDPSASLYSMILVKEVSNESTPSNLYDANNNATIPLSSEGTNYEDILVRVVLDFEDNDYVMKQSPIDNSFYVNNGNTSANTVPDYDPTNPQANYFVINEIGLFSGPKGLNTTPALFTNNPDALMLTHVIFHPIQKSANRALEILYTLRIQMGSVN